MRIAVACDGQNVAEHFGRCRSFQMYDELDDRLGPAQVVPNAPDGHSAAISVLRAARVDALVVGGIGARAVELLQTAGIAVHVGATGPAEESARALVSGKLETRDSVCDHHGASDGHECGHHDHGHHHGDAAGTCEHNQH